MRADTREAESQLQVSARQRTVLVCLLLLSIWLFAHPWEGIWHDARLYALQALSHLRPDAYRNDLFFFAGSQDDYTFFSSIYAGLISSLGLHAATIAFLLTGYVLWIGSAAWLLRSVLPGFSFWVGLVLIFSMPHGYGGNGDQLKYAEPFLTARLIAEGLTLLSLAMMLKGRWLASLAAMAAAFAMHPLMAVAGAGFVAFYAAMERPKVALGTGASGLALLIGLAFFNVGPFGRLLTAMDSQWFDLSFARAPFVFWDGWKYEDWLGRVLLSFSLLAAAGITATGARRAAFLSALFVGCASLLFTWLGTSLLHNVLLIQIQPWRSLWLVQFFSYTAAAWLVSQYWSRGQVYRILLLGFLTTSLIPGPVGGVLALLTSILFISQERRGKEIYFSKTAILLLYLIPILITTLWIVASWLVAGAESIDTTSPLNRLLNFTFLWIRELLAGGGSGVITVALVVATWRYGPDRRKFIHLGTVAGVLFLLFLSIAIWYRPDERQRYYEQWALRDPIPSFTRHMPINAVVYWENDPRLTWFALGRANYASKAQTAGIVFSRQTAIEGKRRIDRLSALGLADGIFEWAGNASRLPKTSVKGLIHVCHDPVLDYVILSKDLGVGVIEKYFDKFTSQHFYLYDCARLRQNFDDTWTMTDSGKENSQGH